MSGNSPETTGFGELYEQLQPPLLRYLQRLTGDSDAAEDVCQEAFVRLLRRADLTGDDARLWIFTVATNLVRDRGRSLVRRQRLLAGGQPPTPTPSPAPDDEVERSERIAGVRQALDRIPQRDRQLLLMREEGFRYEEIAKAVGVAPGSIGTLVARALRKFEAVYRGNAGYE